MITSQLSDIFIQARMHRERRDGGYPRLVVLHDMEAPETLTMAEDLGRNWFANPVSDGKYVYASTHYGVDSNSIVGYVSEDRTAYGANRIANNFGIHIEHAGYARQTAAEWLDDYGLAMLDRSARLTADICSRYQIPIEFLTAADLAAGRIDGITTHAECSKAWGGDHTDPGEFFPTDNYLAAVSLWYADLDAKKRTPVLNKGDHDGKNSLGEHGIRTDKGEGIVSKLQNLLIDAGFELPIHGADGDYGDETAAAVLKFNGNRSTVVRLRDWTALADALKPPLPPETPALDVPNWLDDVPETITVKIKVDTTDLEAALKTARKLSRALDKD